MSIEAHYKNIISLFILRTETQLASVSLTGKFSAQSFYTKAMIFNMNI